MTAYDRNGWPRRCENCSRPLPDGCAPDRRYCCRSCRQRAYERRHGMGVGGTRANPWPKLRRSAA